MKGSQKKIAIFSGVLVIAIAVIIGAITLSGPKSEKDSSKNKQEYTEKLDKTANSYVDFVDTQKRDTVNQEIAFIEFDTGVREKLLNDSFAYDGVDMTGILDYQKKRIEANEEFIKELKKLDGESEIDRTNPSSSYVKAFRKTVNSEELVNLMLDEIDKLDVLMNQGKITNNEYNLILTTYFYN